VEALPAWTGIGISIKHDKKHLSTGSGRQRVYVQGLKLMTVNSNMEYTRKVPEVVRLNLSHMKLPLSSDIPFQKYRNHSS
jgi:hypothetical protein